MSEPTPYPAVVIGGSAGSIEPLQRVVAGLPADLSAAVFVVVHVPPDGVSALPHILTRAGPLFATHGIDRAPIAPHHLFIAPPNHHLIIEDDVMRVLQGPRENSHRPSIDVLFRSAAKRYGNYVTGILLSGTLDDGVAGLSAIRAAGGLTIVQDPNDAQFPDMPQNAIDAGVVDAMYKAIDLGSVITEFVDERAARTLTATALMPTDEREAGQPSIFTCPDCGGTLWELDTQATLRFRCRTGHAYSTESMLSSHTRTLEEALWAAIRALQERQDLLRKIAARARLRDDLHTAERLSRQAGELQIDVVKIETSLSSLLGHQQATQ